MENNIISEETQNGINHLISRNRDAGKGFVEVANNINHVNLTQWLIDWAKIHDELADQLELVMKQVGVEPDSDTSMLGELHHVWIDLKAQWTNNDSAALLGECIRGEETALEDYQEVIAEKEMPLFARNILNNQKSKIQEAVDGLKVLKNSYREMEDTTA